LPACQHQVKDDMEVFTMEAPGADGDRVRQAVAVMAELLAADHLKPAQPPALVEELAPFNELEQVATRCGANSARFKLDVLSTPPPRQRHLPGGDLWISRPPSFSWTTAPVSYANDACAPAMK